MRQLHTLVNDKVVFPKWYYTAEKLPGIVEEEVIKFNSDVGKIHQSYMHLSRLTNLIADLLEKPDFENDEESILKFNRAQNDIGHSLKNIETVSLEIASTMKKLLRQMEERHKLKEALLRKQKLKRVNFKRNLKSWLDLVD